MKSAHVPQHEILPPPIDIAVLAKRNGLSELLSMRSIRSAEKRELAFSRIDSTLRLRWYWTVRQAIPDAGGESRCRLIRGKADLAANGPAKSENDPDLQPSERCPTFDLWGRYSISGGQSHAAILLRYQRRSQTGGLGHARSRFHARRDSRGATALTGNMARNERVRQQAAYFGFSAFMCKT